MSHTVRRAAVLAVATTVAVVSGAGVASAHVQVSSQDATPGGYGVVTFRVPNESDVASTTSVRIQLPTDDPLTFVQAEPVAGWTVTLTSTQLDPPVEADGDQITESVSVVQFTAAAGGGIAPGQFQEFSLLGGPFPDADSLTFNAVQTYSDGTEAAWIEPTVDGQDEPQYPAPVLALTGSGGTAEQGGTADTVTADGGTQATEVTEATGGEGGDGLAVTALVLGGLGLVAGLAGLGLGLAARRRTVGS